MLYVIETFTQCVVGQCQCNAHQANGNNDHTYHDQEKKHCSCMKVAWGPSTLRKQ
jgi:hypothetical protein